MDSAERRLCRYCEQPIAVSRFHPRQEVCASAACQKRRRTDYHRDKRRHDPDYRQICRDSQAKWRSGHPQYPKQYRDNHPAAVERNRQHQRRRDQNRRLGNLVKNTLALDLTAAGTAVYLIGPAAEDLAKNTLAQSKLLIFQPSPVPAGLLAKNTPLDSPAAPAV